MAKYLPDMLTSTQSGGFASRHADHRSGYCSDWVPAKFTYPLDGYLWWNPIAFSPVRGALSDTAYGNFDVAPSVPVLLSWRCPPTIFWAVVSVNVNSVKAMFCGWSLPHIGKEVIERLKPSWTDLNASLAVQWCVLNAWVKTAAFHILPDAVFARVACSMLERANHPMAPTRDSATVNKVRDADYLFDAALASDKPERLAPRPNMGRRYYRQLSKNLVGIVNFAHCITSIMANNHWRARSNRVIEVPLSAAKPSYAGVF